MRKRAAVFSAALSLLAYHAVPAPAAFPELSSRIVFDMGGTYDYFVGAAAASGGTYLLGSQTLTLAAGGKAAWTTQLSGSWGYATGLAVDNEGNAYVAFSDLSNHLSRLIKYGPDGAAVKTVDLPSEYGIWPEGHGVAADAAAGYVYAAEDVYNSDSGRYVTFTFAYDLNLDLKAAKAYAPQDQQTCSDAAIPSGGVHVDAAGNVYVGGYACKDDYTYRYFALKYAPGLGQPENIFVKDAAFDESPQLKAAGDPAGGLVFIGNELDSSGAAGFSVRRLNAAGAWSEPVFITAFDNWSWPKAVAVDKAGAAYIAGNMKDTWAPAVTKLSSDGAYSWEPQVLQKADEGSLETIYVDAGLNMNIAGYHTWNTDTGFDEFYLETWRQGGNEKYSITGATGPYIAVTGVETEPLVSFVTDSNGGGVSGRSVNFSAVPPDGALGYSLTKSSEATEAGQAAVQLKLGNIPAEYYVTAKCPDCVAEKSSVTFTCCGKLPNDDFKQWDAGWATYPYNTQTSLYKRTIGDVGCALTAFSTAINYYANSDANLGISTTNPKALNDTLLKKTCQKGFDPGHNVQFEVVKDTNVSNGKLMLSKKVDRTVPLTDAAKVTLSEMINDALLANKAPVIAKVYRSKTDPSTKKKTEWSHFVLIVGKCGDKYLISDPGSTTRSAIYPFTAIITDQVTQNTFGPVEGIRIFKKK